MLKISEDLVNELRAVALDWEKPLTHSEASVLANVLSQDDDFSKKDEDNLRRFKMIPDRKLQEVSARNYIKQDNFSPFSMYISALEDAGYPSIPLDNDYPPNYWYQVLGFALGFSSPVPEDFIRIVKWFSKHLGRSSSVILFLLRFHYGEEKVTEMAFKLSDTKCDIRSIDFVQIMRDWDIKNFDQNFTLWIPELYRYRTLIDEDVIKANAIPI